MGRAPVVVVLSMPVVRERLTLGLEPRSVRERYHERLRRSQVPRQLAPAEREPAAARGRHREVSRYRSFQHQFPACYGIGHVGLPASATPRRKAQARQLKAYLTLFDQILANQFAQLAHAKDLFSMNGGAHPT